MYERQLNLCPPEVLPPVTIIGCGGIGSRVAEVLSAMGIPKLILWDGDVVEEVNLGPQFYRRDQIGRNKASALGDNIRFLNNPALSMHSENYRAQPLRGVIVLAVDTLAERKRIWNIIIRRNLPIKLLVDGRMGWELGKVYIIPMEDKWARRQFEASLERKTMDVPCSARAVSYNCVGLAAWISAAIKAWTLGHRFPWRITMDFRTFFTCFQFLELAKHTEEIHKSDFRL